MRGRQGPHIYIRKQVQTNIRLNTSRYSCLPRERSNVDMVVQKEAPYTIQLEWARFPVQNWTGLLILLLSTQPVTDTPWTMIETLIQQAIRYHYEAFKGASRTPLFLSKKQPGWSDGAERCRKTISLAFCPYVQRSYTWLTPSTYAMYWTWRKENRFPSKKMFRGQFTFKPRQ